MSELSPQLQEAFRLFDEANSEDPNREKVDGKETPRELVYAQRMTGWLDKLEPEATEALRLAARSQHICRWMIPRDQYPMNRDGYRKWRTTLYQFHAEKAGELLRQAGYGDDIIGRVQQLLRKEHLKTDPEMQLLEDVICLVFLENYFAEFSQKHDVEKLAVIVKKTWNKMSDRGRDAAFHLPLPEDVKSLVLKALKQ